MRLLALTAALLGLSLCAAPAYAAPLRGEADDDAVVVVNGDVDVEPGEVSKGVYIVDGDAHIRGRVDGNVVVVVGDVTIRGRVVGDVVTIAGRARLLPSARVGGDLIYADERPRVVRGASVGGEIDKVDWDGSLVLPLVIGAFVLWLAVSISLAVLGVLLLLIAPRAADAVLEQAEARFWTAVWIGAGIFVALPFIVFVAAVLFVGLPLAIGIGLALLPLAALAYVTTAWTLGRMIVQPPRDRILSFLAGLAILRAVALVPPLAILVWLGAVVVGLGLLGGAIAAARAEPAR